MSAAVTRPTDEPQPALAVKVRRVERPPLQFDEPLVASPPHSGEVLGWHCVHKNTGAVELREKPLDDLPFNRKNWTWEPLGRLSSAPATADGWLTKAVEDVLAERKRQMEVEGWTPEHDDSHANGELAAAATCYAFTAARSAHHLYNYVWPWSSDWWKPDGKRRNLVKAGALILAEIERLDRLPAAPTATGGRG